MNVQLPLVYSEVPPATWRQGIELDTNDQEMVYHGGIVAFIYYAVAKLT